MNKLFTGIVIGILLIGVTVFIIQGDKVFGSAPSGLPATIYKSQTIEIGPDINQYVASSTTSCSSRAITTSNTIRLSFGTSSANTSNFAFATSSPSGFGNVGHIQATNTEVMYDSGLYGCGEWWASSYASSTITITEFK